MLRIVVASDSHGNVANLCKIMDKHADAQAFFFLGDGEQDINEVLERYPERIIYRVCGNCDFYSGADSTGLVTLGGKRIFYTHGHIYNVKYRTDELLYAAHGWEADVVLYGHTHNPLAEYTEGLYVVNPGSCSGRSVPATYAVIDITQAGVVPILMEL